MFDMLKNLIGAFSYRFWSKLMPRHSRKPKKNKKLKPVPPLSQDNVGRCWEAYERFVMLGAVSLGLLQLISLKFGESVWHHFQGFLRTRSRELLSERTVKWVVADLIINNFFISLLHGIMGKIGKRYLGVSSPPQEPLPSSQAEKLSA
jgi:hypothetical protein